MQLKDSVSAGGDASNEETRCGSVDTDSLHCVRSVREHS